MKRPFFWKARKCWFVKVPGEDGRRRNIPLDPDETKALKIWGEMAAAEQPESPTAPFAALAEAFLNWAAANVEPRTYRGYSDFIVSFCNEFGMIRARELKPYHVTRWLSTKESWGAADTRRAAIAAIKRVFNWAVEEGLIDRNYLAGVKKPPPSRREGLITDEQHAAMMLAEDAGRRPGERTRKLKRRPKRRDRFFRPVLVALKHSGARPGMIADVRVEDVSADRTYWIMREHKTRKKTGKPLIIYLSPCLQALTRMLIGTRTSGPLFLNSRGGKWTSNSIRWRMRLLRLKLGLPGGTVAYAYRHTFLTSALQNGVGLATAAELAGHSDLKMMARHYAHLDKQPEHLKAAAAVAVKKRQA